MTHSGTFFIVFRLTYPLLAVATYLGISRIEFYKCSGFLFVPGKWKLKLTVLLETIVPVGGLTDTSTLISYCEGGRTGQSISYHSTPFPLGAAVLLWFFAILPGCTITLLFSTFPLCTPAANPGGKDTCTALFISRRSWANRYLITPPSPLPCYCFSPFSRSRML